MKELDGFRSISEYIRYHVIAGTPSKEIISRLRQAGYSRRQAWRFYCEVRRNMRKKGIILP
jgi:hypothetical protein